MSALDLQAELAAEPRLARVGVTALAIAAMFAVGAPVFLTGGTELVVPVLAALAAGLSLPRETDAAAGAAAGVLGGTAAAPLVSALPWGAPADWLPTALLFALAAGALAAGIAYVLRRAPRLARPLTAAAVALVLVTGWAYSLGVASRPAEDGTTIARVFESPPAITKSTGDVYVYLNYTKRVRAGQDYYRAVAESLQEANVEGVRFDPASPLSYRPPTLYLLLSVMPGGLAPFAAMMAAGSVAALAAFALARRYASLPLALAAAAMVTAFYAGTASGLSLLLTEMWAGAFGLLCVALLVASLARPDRRWLSAAAAAAAASAAVFRELGVAFLLLSLVALIAQPGLRRHRRWWMPWGIAAVVVAGAYAAHYAAVADVVRSLRLTGVVYLKAPWLHLDGMGLPASMYLMTYELAARQAAGWAIAAAALAGSLLGPTERDARWVLGTCVIAGAVLLAFLYPTGSWEQGLPPGYWGGLLIPAILACAPLALAPLPGGRPEPERQD